MPTNRGPKLSVEKELWEEGHDVVVGIDEVGRGAWAGPLTIAAAVLPKDRRVYGVRDPSNSPSVAARRCSIACGTGAARSRSAMRAMRSATKLGMSEAQRLAARRALDGLGVEPDVVLLDGKWDFVGGGRTRTIRQGRRLVPHDRCRLDRGQGDTRPNHAGRGRELPGLRLRAEQGVSVPPPQAGAQGVPAHVDPPAHLGVHGQPSVAGPAGSGGASGSRRSCFEPSG